MKFFLAFVSLFIGAQALADEVSERLARVPGVIIKEVTSGPDQRMGLRRFQATIEQPVDHFDPASPKFSQRLVIFHRGFSEPMVLQTSGYKIFGERLTRLAMIFGTNQIQVEHRYFADSSPAEKDWRKLTVRQSAEDFHRIVEAFKPLYGARWVNTGASKGGMTSIFHRRYYPNDLDGTVADVAPISFALEDARYIDFLNNVGGERYADCRAKLDELQKIVLEQRNRIIPFINGNYTMVGGEDVALEFAAIDMPFGFWQYGDPQSPLFGCDFVPTRSSSEDDVRAFLFEISNPDNASNSSLQVFQPYFFQAAAELGAPASKLDHLRTLMKYPYNLDAVLPQGVRTEYTNVTMLDMEAWMASESNTMMLIYGEFDPWTAGAYRVMNSRPGSDNYLYVVPGANHGANVTDLPAEQKNAALTTLSRWFNKTPTLDFAPAFLGGASADEPLETMELRALRGR